MTNVHFKPEVETLRVFRDGDSYDHRSVPILSCTIHYLGDTKVYVSNLRGTVSRGILRSIFKQIYIRGYREVTYERNMEDCVVNLNKYFK